MKKKRNILLILAILLISSLAVIATKTVPSSVEGYFVKRNGKSVVIKDYSGKEYSLPTQLETYYYVDRRPVEPENFRKGMEVYAEIQNGKIIILNGYSTENPGHEVPEEFPKMAFLKRVDRDNLTFIMGDGSERDYTLSPSTSIQRNRMVMKPEELVIGDKVKLYFESSVNGVISKMEVMGDAVKIKYLYSGTLANVDTIENTITLDNARVYKNGSWKDAETRTTDRTVAQDDVWVDSDDDIGRRIEFNSKLPVYIAGEQIAASKLKLYKNKEVYIAVRDYIGTEIAERVVIKAQNEVSYTTKIETVDNFNSAIELKNKRNITLNPGTIIIKKDRIITPDMLSSGMDGLVVADGRDRNQTASLVYIFNEGINNTNMGQYHLYAGRLQQIVPESVILKDFFVLNDNIWESFGEEKELFFDDEIKLINLEETDSKGNYIKVSPKEFSAKSFSVDEKGKAQSTTGKGTDKDSDNQTTLHRRDWYGYFFMDGDRVTGGVVSKSIDSILKQTVTTGYIEDAPTDDANMGWKIRLRDGKDYSEFSNQWVVKNETIDLYLDKAMIIEGGEPTGIEDIKKDDRVYLIRENNDVKVIIVK